MIRKAISLVVLAAATVGSSGFRSCGPSPNAQLPDLVPVSSDPSGQFCSLTGPSNQLTVIVGVKNQGNADAGASVTTVQFLGVPAGSGSVTINTPPVPVGQTVTLTGVAVPNDCGGPNCGAKITVNANNAVKESDTTNNTLTCNVRIG